MGDKPRLTIKELLALFDRVYSVGSAEKLEEFYDSQVSQYPLYKKWMDLVVDVIKKKNCVSVLEYGFGPGYLTEKILKLKNVADFYGVEPKKDFISITERKINKLQTKKNIKIIRNTAEKFKTNKKFDFVICQAAYHHFVNKTKALKNIHKNLKKDGVLIIPDVFVPKYKYNKKYEPEDIVGYINSVSRYTLRQIQLMPNAAEREAKDQMITWFLDIVGVDEHKVCVGIVKEQLRKAGFKNIKVELLKVQDKKFDWEGLGYYFITAIKK